MIYKCLLRAATLLFALAFCTNGAADSYFVEGSAGYGRGEAGSEVNRIGPAGGFSQKSDLTVSIYGFTLYPFSVTTNEYPLAEAAFADRASYLSAVFSNSEVELQDNSAIETFDSDIKMFSGRYVFENDFLFGLEFTSSDIGDDEDEDKGRSVSMGKYVDDSAYVIRYSEGEDSDSSSLSLNMHSLARTGSADQWHSIDFTFTALKAADESGFGTMFRLIRYPTQRFGFGGRIGFTGIDDVDFIEAGLELEYFVNQNFAGSFEYIYNRLDLGIVESDTNLIQAQLTVRF